jgi:uncharacterized membrane protein YfcA
VIELSLVQLAFVGLIFVWSGFVRAGLGFGGNAMTLPLALLVIDDPLLWLPIFASHLLVFSVVALYGRMDNIEWHYLRRGLAILIVPKVAGVFGLLNLPTDLVVNAIYVITGIYAVTYILDTGFRSSGSLLDTVLLVTGGYASGVSLIGAPLISAVFTRHVPLHMVRDTLFFLWVILVAIKMSAFIAMGVDLQLPAMAVLLLPAALGHWMGSRVHLALIRGDGRRFKVVLGCALLCVCCYGLWSGIRH